MAENVGARSLTRRLAAGLSQTEQRQLRWALLVATTAFCQGLAVSHRLLDSDEANYSAIAALMNAGGRLYAQGGVDNKGPVIFWIYSVVFRLVGLYNLTAIHVLRIVVVLATAAIVAAVARRAAGDWAAWAVGLLYIAFTAVGNPLMASANTEVFMMLPLSASVLAMLDRRWMIAGALVALGTLTKQVGVIQLCLFPLAAALEGDWRRPVLSGGLGFAIGTAVLLGVLGLTGSLSGFWQWAVASLATNYGLSVWSSGQVRMGINSNLLPWVTATPLLWLPAIARLTHVHQSSPTEKLVAGWLVTASVGVVAGGHFFGHYFISLVGPLSVLSGAALAQWRHYVRHAAVAFVLGIVFLLPAFGSVLQDYYVTDPSVLGQIGGPTTGAYLDVSAYVARHSGANQRVFVYGNWPAVYVFSSRLPATRFPGFLRGAPKGPQFPPHNWDTVPAVWPALAQDFRIHPPVLIVDTSTAGWTGFGYYPMTRFPFLPGFVARNYVRAAVVDGVVIYRRR